MAFDMGARHFAWAIGDLEDSSGNLLGIRSFECKDFGSSTPAFSTVVQYLDTLQVDGVNVILIEQQMNHVNAIASRLAVVVYMYFFLRHPGKTVSEYPARWKTMEYGITKVPKHKRKQWVVSYVRENVCRDDPVVLDLLEGYPKKDDICDCIMMIHSYGLRSSRKTSRIKDVASETQYLSEDADPSHREAQNLLDPFQKDDHLEE